MLNKSLITQVNLMAKGHPRPQTQTTLVTRPNTILKETHQTLGSTQYNFASRDLNP
ncbi:hypothetical protein HanXRQr2_Chr13g0579361 [Helianthus annuus]|uniref:Uncharacterized protein n=1 Tax=Helianthus annuus TaxID=4232 RepID=A0A9K3EFI0_HELAN|nr:hypothetical protein HanXRQr2_Chr13g0579361 [Helianthus annuus]KAJ0480357.1 hypothetical protein HanIR_Chr13g0630681 [Helianthus annuus]